MQRQDKIDVIESIILTNIQFNLASQHDILLYNQEEKQWMTLNYLSSEIIIFKTGMRCMIKDLSDDNINALYSSLLQPHHAMRSYVIVDNFQCPIAVFLSRLTPAEESERIQTYIREHMDADEVTISHIDTEARARNDYGEYFLCTFTHSIDGADAKEQTTYYIHTVPMC